MSHPGVSVVIPCFNGARTLGVQLDALAAQHSPVPFEVVVADNGSTDDSAALAAGYADRLDVRVVDARGVQGPAYATNCGVRAARYDELAFCDADDEVAPGWVAAAHAALADHGFVAGRVDVHKLNHPRIARSRCMDQQEGLQESSTGIDLMHAGAGNMAIRRDVFEAVGGFDDTLYALQDADFCWRVQLAGTELTYEPAMLVHTRLRDTLVAMLRQAYHYGDGFARLEARYGVAPTATAGRTGACRWSALFDGREIGRRLRRVGEAGLGGTAWQMSWHLGHQLGRRGTARTFTAPATHLDPPAHAPVGPRARA